MPNTTRSDMKQLKSRILIDALSNTSGHTLYLGVNGTAPWSDEYDPPQPKDTAQELHNFWSHLVGFKRIPINHTWAAIHHIKWLPNRTFEMRRVNEDMTLQMRYYCVNRNYEVYLCIGASIIGNEYPKCKTEPTGHNNGNPINTGDGYTWKFLYKVKTVDLEHKINDNYIPVYIRDVDKPKDQKDYGVEFIEHTLNVRHIGCRTYLNKESAWTATHYRQYGLFVDIANTSDNKIATADILTPSQVVARSGYLIYTENIKKTEFEDNRTDVIDIVIEC